MLELTTKNFVTIYIVKLVLKHSFIFKLITKIKFLGTHIELNDKNKNMKLYF